MQGCTVTTEYERRGLDVVWLENEHLRIEILSEKGGDVTEIRDKRTDTNVLFEAPHEWRAPDDQYVGSPDPVAAFMDHYPGGWQNVVPNAGHEATVEGATFGLHTGATLTPWEVSVETSTTERVTVRLSTSLTRYPFELERHLTLTASDPTLTVEDTIKNEGETPLPYAWLQHFAFGPPLLDPDAAISVPAKTVLVDPGHDVPNTRFEPGTEHDWPTATSTGGETVDLASLPPKDARVHDLLALTDLREGWYDLTSSSLDLGVRVTFPSDLYEYIWYWGNFGGFEGSPFFGRAYNIGLEPCTSVPNGGLEAAIDNNTANVLEPQESKTATVTVTTHDAAAAPDSG